MPLSKLFKVSFKFFHLTFMFLLYCINFIHQCFDFPWKQTAFLLFLRVELIDCFELNLYRIQILATLRQFFFVHILNLLVQILNMQFKLLLNSNMRSAIRLKFLNDLLIFCNHIVSFSRRSNLIGHLWNLFLLRRFINFHIHQDFNRLFDIVDNCAWMHSLEFFFFNILKMRIILINLVLNGLTSSVDRIFTSR